MYQVSVPYYTELSEYTFDLCYTQYHIISEQAFRVQIKPGKYQLNHFCFFLLNICMNTVLCMGTSVDAKIKSYIVVSKAVNSYRIPCRT